MVNSVKSYSSASSYQLPNTRKLENSARPDYNYALPKNHKLTQKYRQLYNFNKIDGMLP